MRDPLEGFDEFKQGGVPVDPLPATEVRRRGDRLRRRNNALTTLGAAAAVVAAVAVPVAVASGDGPAREIQPAPPVVEWHQEVPGEFPLGDGLQEESIRSGIATAIPRACGTPFWSESGTVDVAGAHVSGGEAYDARTLMLYPDPEAAERAVAGIRAAVADCPEQTVEDRAADTTLVYQALPQDLATEESFVFVEQVRHDDGLVSDATITQVARTGNAVLLNQGYSSAGGDQAVAFNQRHQLERGAVPFAAMCMFAADPCAWDGASADPAAAGAIPDDFPLLAAYPTTSEGDGFGPRGPSRDLAPLVPEACGARVEVPEHLDLLRAGWRGPEDFRERQLITFADDGRAEDYLRSVVAVFDECLEVTDGDERRLTQQVTELSGVGDSAGGAITRYELFGAPAPGLDTLLVVRVGNTVLLATSQNEGGAGPDPAAAVQEAFNALVAESGEVIEAMQRL